MIGRMVAAPKSSVSSRGDPEPRFRRFDLFLAGDQRHRICARAIGDLVVDLARQQPQRQADQS
jgi:hypothetical protein